MELLNHRLIHPTELLNHLLTVVPSDASLNSEKEISSSGQGVIPYRRYSPRAFAHEPV